MAFSPGVLTKFDNATIVVKDGTGAPLQVTVRLVDGDCQLSNWDPVYNGAQQRETLAVYPRATLASLRKGAPTQPKFTFSAYVTDLSEATTGTLVDLLAGSGPFSARISTSADIGDVITFTVVYTLEETDSGGSADETLTMTRCAFMPSTYAEGDAGNKISYEITCYGTITKA